MVDLDYRILFDFLVSIGINLATWLRNRRQLKKETQTVRDVLQMSGQEEVFRIENLEARSYEDRQEIKLLKAALYKALGEIDILKNQRKPNEQKKPEGI